MKSSSSRIFDGFTVEGFHYQLQAFYRHGSDTPYRYIGVYRANDGAGEFDVEEERDCLEWAARATGIVFDNEWQLMCIYFDD